VLFVPHPHLEPHITHLCPPGIEVRRFSDRESIQPVFADLDLLVTDVSSKAFDAALLDLPVIYYQFDREEFFGGEHAGAPGYFDYERDGFGPVVDEHETLLDLIGARLKGTAPDAVSRARADATFQFRDGKCCERVLEAIRSLVEP
jgi:CDP-glycerol glycerophosphotransferase (TagB/SpsB family)